MTLWRSGSSAREAMAQVRALSKSQAVIEFELDGTILTANQNFLNAMGYRLDEIKGRHHSMFVLPGEQDSPAYREFWARLARGEHQSAEYKRIGKGGREIWIQASYNPILDDAGWPCKVIKFATDITARKTRSLEDAGKISAIGRVQAVIEFDLDGTIITANQNFLDAIGYGLDEIRGEHHGMLVGAAERDSAAYREFWAKLARGEFQSGEYKRFGKGGKEIWIQASYNPICDAGGKPVKVVKFATDVTESVQLKARAQQVQAVVDNSPKPMMADLETFEITYANEASIEALEKLDLMVELGVPRTLMIDAHFLRGEMLLSTGETDEALVAYQRVLQLNPTRTHGLTRRAEENPRLPNTPAAGPVTALCSDQIPTRTSGLSPNGHGLW